MKPKTFPLDKLLLGDPISKNGWREIFLAVFQNNFSTIEIKTLLLLTAKMGESAEEVSGCLQAIRRLEPPRQMDLPYLIDICGTGGDGMQTFNVSTVCAFVIAGAGGYVAKHGNRSVSSKVGSSDLMETLGVRLDVPASRMMAALRRCHLGYFHAPFYHPSFSHIQPIRRELGVRTLFNLLGPLVNPIQLQFQMVGVSHPEWMEPLSKALQVLKRRRAALVRSKEGLDELSTRSENAILYLEGKQIKRMRLDPQTLGFRRAGKNAYQGGDLATNRKIALEILKGGLQGPYQDIVLLNSGFALWLAGLAGSIQEGIEKSRLSLGTGRALQVLQTLRQITNERN